MPLEIVSLQFHKNTDEQGDIRLFLFQTALASGVEPAFPPLAVVALRGAESRKPLPDFATNLGLAPVLVEGPTWVVVDGAVPLSPSFEGAAAVAPLAARKVLFTETGLKDANFFTVDAERTWPFSSPRFLVSAFEASVSDPPLTLTSAELTIASTL